MRQFLLFALSGLFCHRYFSTWKIELTFTSEHCTGGKQSKSNFSLKLLCHIPFSLMKVTIKFCWKSDLFSFYFVVEVWEFRSSSLSSFYYYLYTGLRHQELSSREILISNDSSCPGCLHILTTMPGGGVIFIPSKLVFF